MSNWLSGLRRFGSLSLIGMRCPDSVLSGCVRAGFYHHECNEEFG